jgi:hypothetical protein
MSQVPLRTPNHSVRLNRISMTDQVGAIAQEALRHPEGTASRPMNAINIKISANHLPKITVMTRIGGYGRLL